LPDARAEHFWGKPMAARSAVFVDAADSVVPPPERRKKAATTDLNVSMPAISLPPSQPSIPITTIKGIGEKVAESFARLGISTLDDLLTHYPNRHEDRSRFAPISSLRDGETATVSGKVVAVENRPTKNRLVLTKVTVDDGSSGFATLTYFNQWRMKQTFERLVGRRIVVYGVVKRGYTSIDFVQPEWEPIDDGADIDSLSVGRIVPIYPSTEGLGQKALRKAISLALDRAPAGHDPLPAAIRAQRGLMGKGDAVRAIHFPDSQMDLDAARRRLVYEELLEMQLLLAGRKQGARRVSGVVFPETAGPVAEFEGALPFTLTSAQRRVVEEIAEDLRSPHPMNRLVQGDVGSGKTAVAMAAMVIAARNGFQSALMAPTEILAEQHLRSIRPLLEELGIRVDLLTGSRPAREKEAVRQRILSGDTGVVVGTHALIQEGVLFARLGLAVIDEQHRFGVLQRAALSGKGANPHVLVMTATPIPRTLTLTVYGDLDVSIIDELPPGRKPIRTHTKKSSDKTGVYEGVRRLLRDGRQAFVVCPLIEESEKLQARAATDLAAHLTAHVLPEFKIGLLHGQMPSDEKDAVMTRFRAGEIDVLVATTVIEVGVDVPNAAVMVIEDADRFGLAQLHQLRGRVGRGAHASFCVLVADPKTLDGEARMRIMCETNDGFRIAEEDLRLRGPGEFYGVRQSGLPSLQIADVLRDVDVLNEARSDAFALLAEDPQLSQPEHATLRGEIMNRRRQAILGVSDVA
jgi:ATP-dependent DNA helicase RecG